ncbi:MAG: DUF4292 domain-containing protein [bacterium]
MVPACSVLLKSKRLLVVFCFVFVSCAAVTAPSPGFDYNRRVFENLLQGPSPGFSRIKGYGKLVLKGKERQDVNINLIFDRPNRARLEILNLFYQPALLIVSDGRRVSIKQTGERSTRTVPVDDFNLEKLTGEKISLGDFVSIMLAVPPDWPVLKGFPCRIRPDGDKVVYDLESSRHKTIRLSVSGKEKRLLEYRVFSSQGSMPEMSVFWKDYREAESPAGVKFPHDIRISWPAKGLQINMLYDSIELHPVLSKQAFSLEPAH